MLSLTIKSDAFIPDKKSCLYKMKMLQKRKVFCFCLNLLQRNVFFEVLTEISEELLQTTLNFVLNFFHLEFYHKKQVHGSHHAVLNVYHKSAIILTFHIFISNLGLA